jgi:hypothetical protein
MEFKSAVLICVDRRQQASIPRREQGDSRSRQWITVKVAHHGSINDEIVFLGVAFVLR